MVALPGQILEVEKLLHAGEDCYLVGGAVRDLLLGRNHLDFDFVCDFDPRTIGRRLADHIGGAFYILDSERKTCRVISPSIDGTSTNFDFARMQGDLLEDLQARDFTVNSIAINLRDNEVIIDPLKGGRDLQEKWLRLCSSKSLQNDPVRVIRAVRYALDLKLKIEPETRRSILQAVPFLDQISIERKRDEFFKILAMHYSASAMRLLLDFGILNKLGIQCGNDEFDHLRSYERLTNTFLQNGSKTDRDFFTSASILSAFSEYRQFLDEIFLPRNSNGHSRLQLGKFLVLNWLTLNSGDFQRGLFDVFSNEELKLVKTCLLNKAKALALLNEEGQLDSRSAYRYFKSTGEHGIDLILLGIAWEARVTAAELNQEKWLSLLANAAELVNLWFHHPEITQPQPFIDGYEMMRVLDMEAGPIVGFLLEELKEEQAAGVIRDKKSAVTWAKNRFAQIKAL